ncbi:GA28568 gene product from transcript GA28568-RA [Rhizoctonia solani AG-1 IB]|uniref:GA28568 gene product from transcript GA28568-RA n=1 Tax=Thanatephorus cucumeris (strain AG1-IB / isolate 7/3/14) TaxID=1108050 RepID=A0A0B7FRH5_THACB|nr:GA28568 gene product from transcript GA28568-RA [Rhizoctonia solani AG-1 IB]
MSRSHSVERESKPLPPVPQDHIRTEPAQVDPAEASSASHFANALRQMVQDLPATEYRSPLNIGGRIHQGLAELTKEVVVPHAGRSVHHHDRHDNHYREREDSHLAETIRPTQREGEGDSFTSAEKIRRGWQERQDSSHHRSQSEELPRSGNNTTSPPTAYRSGEGFPWYGSGSGQPRRQGSFRRHYRDASADTPPQGSEFYENSDESGHSSIRLEVHNATPIYTGDSMKSRGRPSLGSRLRTSFQKARVGAARPARERTDLSRSPSPSGRRSPSPRAWRKPSPHSSIRATDQYSTPRTGGPADQLPRIDSQKMDLGWEVPTESGMQSPPRPPDDAIPTIPDLHTPGVYYENGSRTVPITEPDKPRLVEIHEHPPSHRVETSQSTDATAVNPPAQRDRHRRHRDDSGDHLVLRNFDGSYHPHGSSSEGPRGLKRLLSLTGRPVPIEGDEVAPGQTSSSPTRPKLVSTPSALVRSTSLIRTRSRRKESSKHRERVDPDTHVGYESDPWGEGPEIHRDGQGNRIFPQEPKRKTSQKKKSHVHAGPTKIALPMGQVEEFHSVHSNSPTGPQHLEPSGNTRPGSPTRKMSSQSTQQVKASVPDTKYDGWRRSRVGAPRRPSQTLIASPPSNGNQYADEAPIMDDPPIFTTDPQEYDQELPGHGDAPPPPHHPPVLNPALAPTPAPAASAPRSLSPAPMTYGPRSLSPAPIPVAPMPRSLSPIPPTPETAHAAELRSQSPLPSETSVHIHIVHGPRMPSPAPPRLTASPTPDSPPPPFMSASPALASGPPPLIRTSPPRRNTPPPLISTPPPRIVTPPPAMMMPVPMPAPAPLAIHPRHERPLPSEPIEEPRSKSPLAPIRTPSPRRLAAHASPDHTPPIQTPRAHTPNLEDHIQINPVDTLPSESHGYEDPRYRSHMDPHSYDGPGARSPIPDTPTYIILRQSTPTPMTPGVMLDVPSGPTSLIDRDPGLGPHSPARSVNIEYRERPPTSSMLSNRPMPRHLAGLSESEQQFRQQNRQTGSEMSFVNVEPLTKREKLAASVLSISSMPWLRNRTSSRSHHPDSSYHSIHDGDSRHYYDRYRHPMDYPTSATPPQLPPVDTGSSHTTHPRPDTSKELPAWYPREQTARNPTLSVPPQRESRGPRVGQEAWGWRSSPHGIPEEAEESPSDDKPPWHHGPSAVTPGPDTPRGGGMLAPPVLPPRPAAPHTPEPEIRPSGEKKRVPKYRIQQDERGHPVLVPEPGSDDSRWTVFEIGGVEFKRAPGDPARGPQWMPKRFSGLRQSEARSHDYRYSESPDPVHAPLEGRRQHNA